MKLNFLSVLTVLAAALGAITALVFPYIFGIFPGGFFEVAALGPVPLWAYFIALSLLMLVVLVGHLRDIVRSTDKPRR